MKIQPLSALVGAASLGVVLFTLSAFQTPAGTSPARHLLSNFGITIDGPVAVLGIPTHKDFVVIDAGTPYTVPADKALVLTGVGRALSASSVTDADYIDLTINGAVLLKQICVAGSIEYPGGYDVGGGPDDSVVEFPLGLHADSGDVVDITFSNEGPGAYRLFGYLEDA